jgi:hypothetical protein
VATFAGETSTPPCAPPDAGEANTPPCAIAQTQGNDDVAPGETSAPPISNTGTGYSVADVAIDLLQSMLSLF